MSQPKMGFDWFSIGPAYEGRGYGVRSWSKDLKFSDSEKKIADKLRLAVASWSARAGATVAAALIPPGDDRAGRSVLLLATQGQAAALGTQADAVCVLISSEQMRELDWRPHGLIPDLTQFKPTSGDGPVKLALAPASSERVPVLGDALAWDDLAAVAPAGLNGLAFAMAVIESIDPSAQRERLRGWCAGGLISGSESLDARHAYGFLALPEAEISLAGWSGLTASERDRSYRLSGDVTPPASWAAWRLLRSALVTSGRAGARLSEAPWHAEYGRMEPLAALTGLIREAVRNDEGGGLEILAAAAIGVESLRSDPGAAGTQKTVIAAMERAVVTVALEPDYKDPRPAMAWLLGLLRTVYPHLKAEPGPVVRRAIDAGVLAQLTASDIEKLVPLGLLDELADAVAGQLGSLSQDLRILLLKLSVSDKIVGSPRARRLLAMLLESVSSEPITAKGDVGRAVQEAIRLLREAAPPVERPALLAATVGIFPSKTITTEDLLTLATLVEDDATMSEQERAAAWPGDEFLARTLERAVGGASR